MERSPESIQLPSLRQENFQNGLKLCPPESAFRPFKGDKKRD